jgi:hypothetical protein
MKGHVSRKLSAAGAVVMSAGVGWMINIATSSFEWTAIGGAVALVIVFAALEWWRAAPPEETPPEEDRPADRASIRIRQRVKKNVGGNVTGIAGNPPDADIGVDQEVGGSVLKDGKMVALDGDGAAKPTSEPG